MPMPNDITIANVNAAIAESTILTDNHVMIDRYQSELNDCGREVNLMPLKLNAMVQVQDELIEEVVK